MKKQFLAAAVSCAVLATVAMPSALAVSGDASGQVTSAGDGITFTDGTGGGFVVPSTDTSATLAGVVDKCYTDSLEIDNWTAKYFTVTDTDNVTGHNITVETGSENFDTGADAGASVVPTNVLSLSLEGDASIAGCLTEAGQAVSDVIEKVEGNAASTVADNITLSEEAYDDTSAISYMPLAFGEPALLVDADNAEAFQYKFRIGSLKLSWPQYTKDGTYSAPLVFTYTPGIFE